MSTGPPELPPPAVLELARRVVHLVRDLGFSLAGAVRRLYETVPEAPGERATVRQEAERALRAAVRARQLGGGQQLIEALEGQEPPSSRVAVMVHAWYTSRTERGEIREVNRNVEALWTDTVDDVLNRAREAVRSYQGGNTEVLDVQIQAPLRWPLPHQL